MNIWQELAKPFFVLAPMDDVTDTVFRQIVGECAAPDLYFTEFVNVDGLQSIGRDKLLHRLAFTQVERPLIAQIWGKTPESYYKTSQDLVQMGFDGIDINFGCPVKAVVKDGCCSAMMNNRELAVEVIRAVQAGAGSLPVSVKTRLGYSEVDLTWHELLLGQGLDALTVHGRTKAQMSKIPADWAKIGQVRALRDRIAPATKIIGNGDVLDRAHGLELAALHQLDGVMIGRGVFSDPFVFSTRSPWTSYTKRQKMDLYRRHVELFDQTWPDTPRRLPLLSKFCKIYINGFDGAKEMREELMAMKSAAGLISYLSGDL